MPSSRLIEIYVLIHSRIGRNGKHNASAQLVDDGPDERENESHETERDDAREGGWMRGTRWDEREGRARGRVISFLCLLLIYSDAPRLSASGANKFLEPPWQLDTLPSPHFFPRHPFSHAALFPRAICRSDEIFRPHRTARRRRCRPM